MKEVTGNVLAGKLTKAYLFDAGQDIYSNEEKWIYPRDSAIIHTGLFIEVPKGYVGLLWPRSGLSCKHKIEVGAGCIDYGYKDEVLVHLYNHNDIAFHIAPGMKITQLITIPIITTPYTQIGDWTEKTDRSVNGFGSSGN